MSFALQAGMATRAMEGAAEAKPWIIRLARVGFASKGIVYMLIGILAARAATGTGGKTTGSRGALATILEQPFGRWFLGVIALGLFGYAIWRVLEAIEDPKRRGSDPKGLALRSGSAAKALGYAALGTQAARLALHRAASGKQGDDQAAHKWTALALDQPLGRWLVILAGACLIGYGVYQLFKAWKSKLSDDLSLASLAPGSRRAVIAVSRIGIGARGIVFMVIGRYLLRAGVQSNAGAAKGVGGALHSVAQWGAAALAVIAAGLFAYGIYEVINARYRRIAV